MSDYNFLIENRLSARQFEVLNDLGRFTHAEDINLYLVGGAVRDLTYGRQVIRDLNFAVEGSPERILRHLPLQKPLRRTSRDLLLSEPDRPRAQIQDFRLSRRRDVLAILFSNGVRADLTTCHREVRTRPGKPPEILPATIFDDLRRRDFAMNAMAVSLHPNSRGLLLDPTNGAGDIERQELRALHSRSFYDEPSRIYRLLRLGMRLGFKPDEKTRAWLETALASRLWTGLTMEQQGRELEAILLEDNPGSVLKMLAQRGLIQGIDRKLKRIPYERFRKLRPLLQKMPHVDPLPLTFHCLASGLGTGQRKRLARKIFRFPKTLKLALNLERDAKKLARALSGRKASTPSQAYQLLVDQPEPLLLFLLAYYPQVKIRSRLKNYLFKSRVMRARAPRLELQSLGVRPGPKFEKILSRVFLDQLDGKIKTPQQLTKALRAAAGIKEPKSPPPPERPAAKIKKHTEAGTPPHSHRPQAIKQVKKATRSTHRNKTRKRK